MHDDEIEAAKQYYNFVDGILNDPLGYLDWSPMIILYRLIATAVVLVMAAIFGEYAWIPLVLLAVIWLIWRRKE